MQVFGPIPVLGSSLGICILTSLLGILLRKHLGKHLCSHRTPCPGPLAAGELSASCPVLPHRLLGQILHGRLSQLEDRGHLLALPEVPTLHPRTTSTRSPLTFSPPSGHPHCPPALARGPSSHPFLHLQRFRHQSIVLFCLLSWAVLLLLPASFSNSASPSSPPVQTQPPSVMQGLTFPHPGPLPYPCLVPRGACMVLGKVSASPWLSRAGEVVLREWRPPARCGPSSVQGSVSLPSCSDPSLCPW